MQPTTRVELGLAESATNGSENDKQRFKTYSPLFPLEEHNIAELSYILTIGYPIFFF